MIMWLNFLINEILPRGHVILRDLVDCGSLYRNLIKCIQLLSYNLRNPEPQTDYVSYYKNLMWLQIIEFFFALSPNWQLQFISMWDYFWDTQLGHIFIFQSLWQKIQFCMFLISMQELIHLQKMRNTLFFSNNINFCMF